MRTAMISLLVLVFALLAGACAGRQRPAPYGAGQRPSTIRPLPAVGMGTADQAVATAQPAPKLDEQMTAPAVTASEPYVCTGWCPDVPKPVFKHDAIQVPYYVGRPQSGLDDAPKPDHSKVIAAMRVERRDPQPVKMAKASVVVSQKQSVDTSEDPLRIEIDEQLKLGSIASMAVTQDSKQSAKPQEQAPPPLKSDAVSDRAPYSVGSSFWSGMLLMLLIGLVLGVPIGICVNRKFSNHSSFTEPHIPDPDLKIDPFDLSDETTTSVPPSDSSPTEPAVVETAPSPTNVAPIANEKTEPVSEAVPNPIEAEQTPRLTKPSVRNTDEILAQAAPKPATPRAYPTLPGLPPIRTPGPQTGPAREFSSQGRETSAVSGEIDAPDTPKPSIPIPDPATLPN